ncbi:MAG: hypothetical protein KGJ33_02390 [Patescibacteria group bacterium]|nr:hypothetical protein [Patescibacteria group bacterium]
MSFRLTKFAAGSFLALLISFGGGMAWQMISVLPADAQGLPTTIGGLELTASTNSPVPGSAVTITAASYSTNINAATLSWNVNGTNVQTGVGLTSLEITAPAAGKSTIVKVTATTPAGLVITNSMAIQSGSVDMIVEPDGYVPPFFPGKTAAIYQNTVRIVAVPHLVSPAGTEYDPATLIYSWKKNDMLISDQSGYGKQSISLPGDIIPRTYTITVTASTRDGSASVTGLMDVNFDQPSIVFYENDPLYGPLYNTAITNTLQIGSQNEQGIIAVPYGFNTTTNGANDLTYSWQINGIDHSELSSNPSVILRAPGNSAGSSAIQLQITNTQQILQSASAAFSATFSLPHNSPAANSF